MAPVSQVERLTKVFGSVILLCCNGKKYLNTYYMWGVVVARVVILSVCLGKLWFRVSWIQVSCGFQKACKAAKIILSNTCFLYRFFLYLH